MRPQKPKSPMRWLSFLPGVALAAIVVVGLVFILRSVPAQVQPGQVAVSSQIETPATTPIVETVPAGDSNVIVLPPVEVSSQWTATPTWTPYPSPTPRPTATLIPGPTATPRRLPSPASDAAGTVLYAARLETGMLDAYSIAVDEAGLAQYPSTKLMQNSSVPWGRFYPSPDGSRIVTVKEDWGGRYVIYTDTGKSEPLFRNKVDPLGLFFGWHPDSRHVLIRTELNYPDVGLWLVDVDTGDHITVFNQSLSPSAIRGGAVSPDGQQVVYSVEEGILSPSEIWIAYTSGRDRRRLLPSESVTLPDLEIGSVFALSWSPDGKKIAFFGNGLMAMNIDGSDLRTLTYSASGFNNFVPVWSPDSRIMAFVVYKEMIEKGAMDKLYENPFLNATIHLINVETGEERPILNDESTGHIDPAWSPDGYQIAFVSTRSGTSEIWAVNVDGSNLRQISNTGEQQVRFPHWQTQQVPIQ